MTCAVCTSSLGPFALEPLGRNDALVNVCRSCRTDPPVADGSQRDAYGGGTGPSAPMQRDMTEAMDRMMGAVENARTTAQAIRYGKSSTVALTEAERDLGAMIGPFGYRRNRTGGAANQDLHARRRERMERMSEAKVRVK